MRVESFHNPASNESLAKALRRTVRFHLADWLGMRIKPLKLRVKLTNRCNARCFMCNVWKMQDNAAPSLPQEIPLEGYERFCAVNRSFLSRLTRISLTGGEPTLRRDFVEIAKVFSEAFPRADMSVNTNGFSTRRILESAQKILEFRKKLIFMVSLDGIGEAHDATRGVRNVFPKVLDTIDGLLEMKRAGAGLKVEVNHVMTERNAEELPRVAKFCRQRGIYLNPIYVIPGQLYDNEEVNLSYSAPLREKLMSHVRDLMRDDHSLQLREVLEMLEGKPRDFDCWAGRVIFVLEDDGELYPNGGCPKGYLLGNVKDFDYDLRRLLRSKQARAVIQQAKRCRLCRLSCETMTTLQHPEALAGWRRARQSAPL